MDQSKGLEGIRSVYEEEKDGEEYLEYLVKDFDPVTMTMQLEYERTRKFKATRGDTCCTEHQS